jgi:hypothetical protein
MIKQILSNNNERCYSNFSSTFREVNTPLEFYREINFWWLYIQNHFSQNMKISLNELSEVKHIRDQRHLIKKYY